MPFGEVAQLDGALYPGQRHQAEGLLTRSFTLSQDDFRLIRRPYGPAVLTGQRQPLHLHNKEHGL